MTTEKQTFQVIPRTRTIHYFTCPNCDSDEEITFTHLVNRLGEKITDTQSFGPWSCDNCQHQLFGEVYRQNDGSIGLTVEARPVAPEDQRTEGLVLLRSTNANRQDPIYLVVHDSYVAKQRTESNNHGKEYWYDEHTCPTNWMRDVVGMVRKCSVIMNGEDTDPHGIFEYVKHYSVDEIREIFHRFAEAPPEGLDHLNLNGDHIQILFPELFGITVEGETTQPALEGEVRLLTNEGS